MIILQYADDLYAMSCKVVDVYKESSLNDFFIEGVDAYIFHSLKEHWALSLQSDLDNIFLKAHLRLVIQNESTKSLYNRNQNANGRQYCRRSWNTDTTNVVDVGSAASPANLYHRPSKSLPVVVVTVPVSSLIQTDTPSSF